MCTCIYIYMRLARFVAWTISFRLELCILPVHAPTREIVTARPRLNDTPTPEDQAAHRCTPPSRQYPSAHTRHAPTPPFHIQSNQIRTTTTPKPPSLCPLFTLVSPATLPHIYIHTQRKVGLSARLPAGPLAAEGRTHARKRRLSSSCDNDGDDDGGDDDGRVGPLW